MIVPPDCIIYGIADDGAPVYQVLDSNGTPVLVIGENGGSLLRFVAHQITQTKNTNVKFFILTNTPASWGMMPSSHCYGIMNPHDKRANDWILDTEAQRVASRIGDGEIRIIFIDGLECVDDLEVDAAECLRRWVVLGPKYNIFAIASYLPIEGAMMHRFFSLSRNTFVYGKISSANVAQILLGREYDILSTLGENEFVFFEDGEWWVKFRAEVQCDRDAVV